MKNKTVVIICSLVLGFFCLGVVYCVSSNFSGDNAYSSVLSLLFERNKKEEATRLFERIEAFDDEVHPYRDIIGNDRYDELLAYIVAQCPPDTALLGEQKYNKMRQSARVSDKVMEQSLGVRALLSSEKFEKITAQRYLGKYLSLEEYCIQKYANIAYQKRLSEVHTELVLSTGILRDQQKISSTDIAYQKKSILKFIENRDKEQGEHLLPEPEHQHGSADDQQVDFSVNDRANPLHKLNAGEKKFAELFVAITKEKIFKSLALLQAKDILSLEDSIRIIANIDLIIPESCYNRDAHYAFLQQGPVHELRKDYYEYESEKRSMSYDISVVQKTLVRPNDHVRVYKNMEILGNNMIYKQGRIIKFTGISFSVPICNNYDNLIDFSRMMEYTILHELGHYYMHRNDADPHEFMSICRDASARLCEIDSFVTEYASTSGVEDYAETFAHVVFEKLYGYFPLGVVSPERKNYFLDRFALDSNE